jgi:N-acetylglucosamine repressor
MKFSPEQTTGIESEILKRVRSTPGISRIALARKLQIAPSTIGNYTVRLIDQGYLKESPATEKVGFEPGRPATALQLNPDGGQFIGVDFEARNIMVTSVDFSDRPLKHAHRPIHESDSVAEVIEKIEQAILEVMPEHPGQLLAIGIGVPGLVDPIRGISVHYKYIKNWQNVPLIEKLAPKFNVPVYLENNVRSMALAELWFGQGRGLADWLCLGIRSGIGAGIVAGGQLLRGANYRAGEVGRWRSPWPQRPATRFFATEALPLTTNPELQEVASARVVLAALERMRQAGESTVLAHQPEPLTIADVVRATQQQDFPTLQIIEVAAEALGWAVSELALALSPDRIILAGPLTLLGDTLLQPLRTRAQELLRAAGADTPLILNSTMGEYSGALGAAALAVHEWKPVR